MTNNKNMKPSSYILQHIAGAKIKTLMYLARTGKIKSQRVERGPGETVFGDQKMYDFRDAKKHLSIAPVAVDCMVIMDARNRPMHAIEKICLDFNLNRSTVDRTVSRNRMICTRRPVDQQSNHRKFVLMEDWNAVKGDESRKPTLRSINAINKLSDDEYILNEEAMLLGFTLHTLKKYGDGNFRPRQNAQRQIAVNHPLTGRPIRRAPLVYYLDQHPHTFAGSRLGDLREIILKADSRPAGMITLAEASQRTGISIPKLGKLVASKTIAGELHKSIRKNGSPEEMWFVKPESIPESVRKDLRVGNAWKKPIEQGASADDIKSLHRKHDALHGKVDDLPGKISAAPRDGTTRANPPHRPEKFPPASDEKFILEWQSTTPRQTLRQFAGVKGFSFVDARAIQRRYSTRMSRATKPATK